MPHQYIARETGEIVSERLIADRCIALLYNRVREQAPALFRALTSARCSSLLGFMNYDLPLGARLSGADTLVRRLGIDLEECLQPAGYYTSPRRIFERQIRYSSVRPMDEASEALVSPADSRMLTGSLDPETVFFIKDKFFGDVF